MVDRRTACTPCNVGYIEKDLLTPSKQYRANTKEAGVVKTLRYIGLDVHKNFITIAIADQDRDGEVRVYGNIDYDMKHLDKFIRKQISQGVELKFVYEAGPCGYALYRHLIGNGIDCIVVAPSQIPSKSGDRIKNDRRDAIKLARLHRAGELTKVYVPNEEDEALRDLTRGRGDAVIALRIAKQQLKAFLLRYNRLYSGKTSWTPAHFNWLADISMPHPGQQLMLQEYINTVESCTERVKRLSEQVVQLAEQSRLKSHYKAFQAMRGISTIVAAILISELGDLKRFNHPEQLMSYLGLVPSEYSSGGKERRGSITKTGNGHVRRALVEAAHAYRLPARISRAIKKRQEELPDNVKEIAWKAQVRLCKRHQALLAKGKKYNVTITATARELSGFVWAIAQKLPLAA